MSIPDGSLATRTLSAVKWNYFGVAARIASQLVVQVALARLLGADSLGLFAFAFLVVGVGGIIVEMGLGAALVQQREVRDIDVRAVFTRVVLVGVGVAALAFGLAPAVAVLMGDPRLPMVIRGLAPVFVLQAVAITPLALLKRELAFKTIQVVQIASYLAGFLIVGVGMAALGGGIWSLVAAWIVQSAVAAVGFHAVRPHSLMPSFRRSDRAVESFGLRVFLTNTVNWVIENVDNLVVGRFFGSAALGFYSVSYNLVRTPANHLVASLQAVLFPATARAQDKLEAVQRAYLTVLTGVSLIALPLFLGTAVVADTLISALFGLPWQPAARLLGPLAVAMAFHAPMAVAGPVLWGRGLAGVELKVQICTAVVLIAVLIGAGRYSVETVAWGVCGVYCLRFVGMTMAVAIRLHLPIARLLNGFRGPCFVAALATGLLIALERALPRTQPVMDLIVEGAVAAVALGAFLYFFPGLVLSRELAALARRLGKSVRVLDGWLKRVDASYPDPLSSRVG